MNVWYCQGPDPFDVGVAVNIASEFQTGYGAILACLSQDVSYTEIEVSNLGGVATGSFSLFITPPDVGEIVQDSLPGSVAFCVSLRSALAGRRFRGRKYFSGLGEGDVTANEFLSTRAADLVTAVEDLRAGLATLGNPMSIFSPTGLTLVPVINVTAVDLRVDSQRGRLR